MTSLPTMAQDRTRQGRSGILAAIGLLAALAPAHAGGGARCGLAATPLMFGGYVPFSNAPSGFTATST